MQYSELRLDLRHRYSLLSPEQKRLYIFMAQCIMHGEYEFVYKDKWFSSIFDKTPVGYPTLEHEDPDEFFLIDDVYDAMYWDFPEFYYVVKSRPEFRSDGVISVLSKRRDKRYSPKEIERLNKRLDRLYHEFDDIKTGFELEVAVNDYITQNFDYEYNEARLSPKAREEMFTPIGLLKRGRAVCAGITRLAQYIFLRRGMKAVPILVFPKESNENKKEKFGHCWLAVELGGHFYHLDITNNEYSINHPSTAIKNMTFNVTDKEMLGPLTEYEIMLDAGIVCNSAKYNYFKMKGLYYTTPEAVFDGVIKFLRENAKSEGKLQFYFRVSKRMKRDKTEKAISEAIATVPTAKHKVTYCKNYYLLECSLKQKA